ncbi:hypothetical protein EIP86_008945 [Pleurotus ostreatoroseus]|nr:hypothetical protein EIP86_008945 [Pleurotus ostreatoroseus]
MSTVLRPRTSRSPLSSPSPRRSLQQRATAAASPCKDELSKLDLCCVRLPAELITPAKAFLFINSERSRKKVGLCRASLAAHSLTYLHPQRKVSSREEIVGSALGRHAISQVISALEARRRDCLHQFRKDLNPDVRIALREDEQIKEIEAAAKYDEPKRIAKAQALKAADTSADTYTEAQLFTVAKRFLDITSGPKKLAVEV